jgi:hypothetical protein
LRHRRLRRLGAWTGELHFDATNGCLKRSLLGLYDSRRQSWFRRKQPGHQNGPGTTVRGLTLDGVVRQRRYGTGNHFYIYQRGLAWQGSLHVKLQQLLCADTFSSLLVDERLNERRHRQSDMLVLAFEPSALSLGRS